MGSWILVATQTAEESAGLPFPWVYIPIGLALLLVDRRVPLIVHKHNEDSWWRRWPLKWFHVGITLRVLELIQRNEAFRFVTDVYDDFGRSQLQNAPTNDLSFGKLFEVLLVNFQELLHPE